MTKNKIFFKCILSLILVMLSFESLAFTSIATIKGHADLAWNVSYNYKNQKEADKDALEGCRVEARKNGISNLAKSCKVVDRAKGAGYGAYTCGDNLCSWVMGYESQQEANDAVVTRCNESDKNCKTENLTIWEDFAGFKQVKQKQDKLSQKSCVHTSHCQSTCYNGNCLITYDNGCKVQVQVNSVYDPFTNTSVFPAPGC